MPKYYDPQSYAPILQQGAQEQAKYNSQVTGASGGLPALGGLAQTGVDTAIAGQKKQMSLDLAKRDYANYLALSPGDQNLPDNIAHARLAAQTLGLGGPNQKENLVDPTIMDKWKTDLGLTKPIEGTKENEAAAAAASKSLGDARLAREKAAADAKAALAATRGQDTAKQLAAFGDALDPSKGRAGAFGVSKNVFDQSERLQSMANAAMGNPNPQQMEELAIGVNKMLSGSSSPAQQQVAALVPRSFIGDANKLRQWLSNEPTGTGQQAFVKNLLDTVSREKATAADQIKRTQFQRSIRFQKLEKQSPDEFYNVLQAQGIEPEEYKKWRASGFKTMSAVQQAPVSSGRAPQYSQTATGAGGKKIGLNTATNQWEPIP